MNKITLSSEEALQIWGEEESDNYIQIDNIFAGEWRWGNNYNVVIEDKTTGKYYQGLLKEQIGDNYHVNWEDEPVTFTEVERVEVKSYAWKVVE